MMPLHTVRPNIVQAIRAFRVEDLQSAAHDLGQHFLYANLGNAQSKQEVLDGIAAVVGVLVLYPRSPFLPISRTA